MDRFFSKLDLRDIKIDLFKTSYPPDADDDAPAATVSSDTEPTPVIPTAPTSTLAMDRPATDEEASPAAAEPWRGSGGWPTMTKSMSGDDGPDQEIALTVLPTSAVGPTNGHLPPQNGAAAADPPILGAREPALSAATTPNSDVLKVSARSRPSAVAGAIAGVVREAGRAEVQAIGAGATNQAVKAVAIARDYLRETGIEAICLPAFIDVTIENEDRTAIRLVVEPR